MILPQQLLDSFNKKLGFYSCTVSAFEQFALARFINQGFFGKHIIRMKNYYRSLRNALIQSLQNSKIAPKIQIKEEDSGLHFLLQIDSIKTKDELQKPKTSNLRQSHNFSKLVKLNSRKITTINEMSLKKNGISRRQVALAIFNSPRNWFSHKEEPKEENIDLNSFSGPVR